MTNRLLIARHELDVVGDTTCLLSVDARIIHIGVQSTPPWTRSAALQERLYLWEEHDPDIPEAEKRTFIVVTDGRPYVPDTGTWLVHVGTALSHSGFAFHVYEVETASTPAGEAVRSTI